MERLKIVCLCTVQQLVRQGLNVWEAQRILARVWISSILSFSSTRICELFLVLLLYAVLAVGLLHLDVVHSFIHLCCCDVNITVLGLLYFSCFLCFYCMIISNFFICLLLYFHISISFYFYNSSFIFYFLSCPLFIFANFSIFILLNLYIILLSSCSTFTFPPSLLLHHFPV